MNTLDPRKTPIAGTEYEFFILPVKTQLSLTVKFTKLGLAPLGRLLSQLASEGGKISDILNTASFDLGGVLELLADRLDEAEVVGMVETLLTSVRIQAAPVKLETHFQGKMGVLMQVLGEALKENFGDFFDELKGLVTARKAASTQVPATSTGASGESSSPGSPRSKK